MTTTAVWILNGVLSTAVLVGIVGVLLAAIGAPGEFDAGSLNRRPRRRFGTPGSRPALVLNQAPAGLTERVDALEAENEIRWLMAAYVRARDLSEGSVEEYFTHDAVWEGVGALANVLGRHEGRSAIALRFAGRIPPAIHLLANESIVVDGDRAVGEWTYLQPTVLNDRAHWVVARYNNDFRRAGGMWRLRHVRIEPIFQASYEDGWAAAPFFSNGHRYTGVSP